MQKLKLQYFGNLMQRVDSLEKTQIMGKIEGRRRRGRQRMRWLDGITNSMDMSLSMLYRLSHQGSNICICVCYICIYNSVAFWWFYHLQNKCF